MGRNLTTERNTADAETYSYCIQVLSNKDCMRFRESGREQSQARLKTNDIDKKKVHIRQFVFVG
jgi:hypothetical protein